MAKAARVRLAAAAALATLFAALGAAACRFTSGLTGGGGSSEGGADEAGCDADPTQSAENCGACGHACDYGPSSYPACVDGGCVLVCAGNYGDCDDAGATGCETPLGSSRTSCGKCGHDCLGGSCSQGQCLPVQLANEQNNAPVHFVIDGTYIFGINAYGTVTRRFKDGRSPQTVVQGDLSPQWPPPRITLQGTTLYYTEATSGSGDGGTGKVSAVSADGGSVAQMASGNAPYAITAGGGYVYWSESGGGAETSTIRACRLAAQPADAGGPVASCAAVTTIVPQENGTIEALALHAKSLYYANAGQTANLGSSALRRCDLPVCGAGTENLAPLSPQGPYGLAADNGGLLWTTRTGYVLSCAYPCSAVDTFDMAQPQPRFLAVDPGSVFWTNGGDGTIRTVQRNTSPTNVERIVYEQGPPGARGMYLWDIAVDTTAIYWSNVESTPPLGSKVELFRLAR